VFGKSGKPNNHYEREEGSHKSEVPNLMKIEIPGLMRGIAVR